jgi:hypothetical protein
VLAVILGWAPVGAEQCPECRGAIRGNICKRYVPFLRRETVACVSLPLKFPGWIKRRGKTVESFRLTGTLIALLIFLIWFVNSFSGIAPTSSFSICACLK